MCCLTHQYRFGVEAASRPGVVALARPGRSCLSGCSPHTDIDWWHSSRSAAPTLLPQSTASIRPYTAGSNPTTVRWVAVLVLVLHGSSSPDCSAAARSAAPEKTASCNLDCPAIFRIGRRLEHCFATILQFDHERRFLDSDVNSLRPLTKLGPDRADIQYCIQFDRAACRNHLESCLERSAVP